MKKLAKCQKEFIFNSRYLPDLRVQHPSYNSEEFPKMAKRLCKYTGNVMVSSIPDQMSAEDYIEESKKDIDCMLNQICKNCEYYDFF